MFCGYEAVFGAFAKYSNEGSDRDSECNLPQNPLTQHGLARGARWADAAANGGRCRPAARTVTPAGYLTRSSSLGTTARCRPSVQGADCGGSARPARIRRGVSWRGRAPRPARATAETERQIPRPARTLVGP